MLHTRIPSMIKVPPPMEVARQLAQAGVSVHCADVTGIFVAARKLGLAPCLYYSADPFHLAARDWALAHELGHLHHWQQPEMLAQFAQLAAVHCNPPPPPQFIEEAYADYYSTVLLFLTPVSFKARYTGAMHAQGCPVQPARHLVQAKLWSPHTHAFFGSRFEGRNYPK